MPNESQSSATERDAIDTMREASRAQLTFAQVYQERCAKAQQRYLDALESARSAFAEAPYTPPIEAWRDASAWWVDAAQRTVLLWDTLRQRGNNWIAHEKAGKPPLLDFDWEMIADARTFERPVNYALVRIIPPPGAASQDPKRRPFIVIDPRAGHGPGIGGFKQDSQVGVALKAGHPVYFVIFFPEPEHGQTLADVSRAETDFLDIVRRRHGETGKPVIIGNCQGGWAAMLVGALAPDLCGPIVINGAPMSYWAGNDGENPMRYAGGILGGAWPALFASDLGAGKFDGAHLVDNFEYLNPANTYFDKLYNLYSRIDTEPERYLEFERWWGGYFMMERQEIKWIVENLFVGNKLASGEAEWSDQRAFDLRAIKSPIILFASLGDNITPPQQAFNWVADLYKTTDELKANGQVIVGLMHESVGHLGIFVSGKVAQREHAQIVDLIQFIEHLPPGLYGMQVEEKQNGKGAVYDVVLNERRVEDLQELQRYSRRDEQAFKSVAAASDALTCAYEAFVAPLLGAAITPAAAAVGRALHPQRMQRWAISDLNPWVRPVEEAAKFVAANRATRDAKGLSARAERWMAAVTSASLDYYRDIRDANVENAFFRAYGPSGIAMGASEATRQEAEGHPAAKESAIAQKALARMREGDRTAAMTRVTLLLMKSGKDRGRLSAMKKVRDLFGKDIGLLDLPSDEARKIIRQQSYIVELAPQEAVTTLPHLLPTHKDHQAAFQFLNKVRSRMDLNPEQERLISDIHESLQRHESARRHNAEIVPLSKHAARRRSEPRAKAR
ncbi:MAG: poly(3-hydroxybutyrate) depolymerase [Hyphomicrobiales bacterium]|nr:poly(3-hydroxybutyrate) depolymerase [Hyphomicrobiales bacterium]